MSQKPGDLPVSRATRPEFVVNLKTAKTIGLTIAQMLLAADEVMQIGRQPQNAQKP